MLFRKIKNKLIEIKLKIVSYLSGRAFLKFPKSIKIQSPLNTIKDIENIISNKIPGAYLRFGDGDVNLLNNIDDLLQKSNKKFSFEMKEAFSLSGPGILKCLPLHSNKFGKEDLMKPGFHSSNDVWAEKILRKCFEYFIGEKIYSHVALSYIAVTNEKLTIDFLKMIKRHKPIFVGNENVSEKILLKLFDSKVYIKCPSSNSYEVIDKIEKETLEMVEKSKNDYILVVVAMGCAGRVLEKRIINNTTKKVFLFDFGSLLDILSGWESRAWMSNNLSQKDQKYWGKMIEKI